MPKPLSDFTSIVKKGLANGSHFMVDIAKPKVVSSNVWSEIETILLLCESASLPGVLFQSSSIKIFGESYEYPNDRLFDQFMLSFLIDKDFKVKKFFDEWTAGIQNPRTRTFAYYNDYTTQIKVSMYDRESNHKYDTYLYEAYPKIVSMIDVANGLGDALRMDVTFQYKYWTTKEIESPISGVNSGVEYELNKYSELMKSKKTLDYYTDMKSVKKLYENR